MLTREKPKKKKKVDVGAYGHESGDEVEK